MFGPDGLFDFDHDGETSAGETLMGLHWMASSYGLTPESQEYEKQQKASHMSHWDRLDALDATCRWDDEE